MLFEEKPPHALDWITAIIVGIALVLGWMNYYKVLPSIAFIKFGNKHKSEERDIGKTDLKEILLDFCFFIITALLITQFLLLIDVVNHSFNGWKLFLKVILGLAIYLIAQRFVHSLHGYITNSAAFFHNYNSIRIKFFQQATLLIFPVLVLSIYAPFWNLQLAWVALSVLTAAFVLSLFKTLRFTSLLQGHFIYHIIFYLCAIEILPLLILYKTLI